MKKIVRISLILSIIALMLCAIQNVYAASNCKIDMQTDKNEYLKGDKVIINVKMTNVQSEMGITAMGGTLKYDESSLQLDKIEGQNGWTTPFYNKENGKMASDNNTPNKSDENVLKITFTVKDDKNSNANVSIEDVTASDSTLIKMDNVSKSITIKNALGNSGENNNNNNGNNSGNIGDNSQSNNNTNNGGQTSNNIAGTNNAGNNSNSNKVIEITTPNKLPKTGETNIVLLSSIVLSIVSGIVYFIKIKIIK